MDKIEQAREALAAKGREVGFLSIEDIDEVFASLSTSTPVDGVEPVAQLIKGLRHAASARSDRLQQTQAIDNAIAFLSALASPEAEARLRERVVEGERLRFEGELDKWMKIIGAGITGYQPEAYAVMDAACRELVSLRGMNASLVLPDGCCGYTDADGACCSPTLPSEIDAATDVACGVDNTYGGEVLCGEDRAIVELGLRRLVGAGWTVAAEARLAQAERATARVVGDVVALLQTWAVEIGVEEPGFWGRLASRAVLAKRAAEVRLRGRVAAAVKAERERIIQALEAEADVRPCAEDAVVTRSNAQLIRADFSYEEAERLDIAAEARLAQAEGGPAVTATASKVQLWFFRDMSDDQRLALFRLCGMPVNELKSQSIQRHSLHRIIAELVAEAALHPQSAAGEEGK